MSGSVQTQATNLLSGIPFGYLIGAPLVAAIDAQGLAASETVKFIEAVGFTTSGGSPPVTTAQTVTFTYTKPVTPTGGGALGEDVKNKLRKLAKFSLPLVPAAGKAVDLLRETLNNTP